MTTIYYGLKIYFINIQKNSHLIYTLYLIHTVRIFRGALDYSLETVSELTYQSATDNAE